MERRQVVDPRGRRFVRLRGRKNSHIIALDIKKYISADQSADAILREIRQQGALHLLPVGPP